MEQHQEIDTDKTPRQKLQALETIVIRAKPKENRFLDSLTRLRNYAEFVQSRFVKRLQKALPAVVAAKLGIRHQSSEDNTNNEKEEKKITAATTDENAERGNWSNQVEFVISCIGFAVGLGNVWRFPYLCYRNGGGAFLVIYWILSALVGFPVMIAEQSIGQYTSQGPLHCWQFAPVITGIGMAMVAVTFLTAIYYNIIITWAFYYLFSSFTTHLPWEKCEYDDWADYRCEMQKMDCLPGADYIRGVDGLCYNMSEILKNPSFSPRKITAGLGGLSNSDLTYVIRNISTVLGVWNETIAADWGIKSVLASDQFYHNYVLGNGDPSVGWNNYGFPRWGLVLILMLIWTIVFLTELNGIKTSGKVVYVTALAPYAVLFILIIRGVTLPGAYEGIMYFLTPDFELISRPEVWYAAAGQLFYSLSVCWGGMITLASYNRFQNNIVRDALIVTFADSFTSFIASFAIFSVIGYGAYMLERPVDKVVEAGAGLAFIVYPKVLSQLPGAVGFSIIFFMMLICIGLSTTFNHVQTIFTTWLDIFPILRKNTRNKHATLFVVCVVCFLLGLPFLCPGGAGLLQIFDEYAATWAVLLIGLLETTALCWIYGFRRFTKDLRLMMNWIPVWPAYILEIALWGFITPGVLAFIMFFIWIRYEPRSNSVEEGVGWLLTWFVAIWMPLAAVWVIATRKGTLQQRIVQAFSPSEKWGPYLERFRVQAKHLKATNRTQSAPGVFNTVSKPSSERVVGELQQQQQQQQQQQHATDDPYRVIHPKQWQEMPSTGCRNFDCRSIETFELSEYEGRGSSRRFEEREVTMIPMCQPSSSSGACCGGGGKGADAAGASPSSWVTSITSRAVMIECDNIQNL